MERKRILEKQSISEEIKLLKKYIETDQATIDRLYKQTNCTDYTTAQIDKLTLKNEERLVTIEKLEQRYNDVGLGLCDDEINTEYKQTAIDIKAKSVETKRKKIVEKEEQKVLEEKSKVYYDTSRHSDRQHKYDQKDMDRSYNYFLNVCGSVPEYMSKKLKNMPNNKGYIWRGVFCYGEKPAEENQSICMFENKKGVLLTHEWTSTDYNVWIKEDTSSIRKLVSTEKRKHKNAGFSLFDFVKKNDNVPEVVSEITPVKEESSVAMENNNINNNRRYNNRNNTDSDKTSVNNRRFHSSKDSQNSASNNQGYRGNRNNQNNNQGNNQANHEGNASSSQGYRGNRNNQNNNEGNVSNSQGYRGNRNNQNNNQNNNQGNHKGNNQDNNEGNVTNSQGYRGNRNNNQGNNEGNVSNSQGYKGNRNNQGNNQGNNEGYRGNRDNKGNNQGYRGNRENQAVRK